MKPFHSSALFSSSRRVLRVVVCALSLGLAGSWALAQDAQRGDGERRRGGGDEQGGRRSMSPQEMQTRMLANLKERFGVTDDAEWAIISERLAKVSEARRASGSGAPGGMAAAMMFRGAGGGPGGGGNDGGDRGGFRGARTGGTPEMQALQSAVTDKLPDAEVKARLTKLRETRKANEKKLEAAQEELRAVLTVRQEALAVMMGLLP